MFPCALLYLAVVKSRYTNKATTASQHRATKSSNDIANKAIEHNNSIIKTSIG